MKTLFSLLLLTIIYCINLTNAKAQSWSLTGNAATTNNNFLGTTDNKPLKLKTNNALRMTIKADGKMGIGTSAPEQELHLVGTMQIDRTSIAGATTPALILNGLVNNIVTVLKVDGVQKSSYGYDVSTNDFVIATDDIGLRPDFIINRTFGYVGLGTKTPGSRLHVVDGDFELTNNSENFFIRTNSSGDLQFIPNNAGSSPMVMINDDNGNVGIGTITPTNKLDVEGGANFFGNIGVQTAANTRTIQCGSTQGALLGIGTLEYIQDAGTNTLSTANDWVPVTDNLWSLGNSSNRWQDVWAVDGTINTSDATMKTNISDMRYGLDAIMKLHPVSFQWKNDQSYTKLGVIAQEIQKVLPEVVRDWDYVIDETTGAKTKVASEKLGVMYDDIIPVLIKGIQEQQQVIESLQSTVSDLQLTVSDLQKQLSSPDQFKSDNSQSIINNLQSRLEQNIPNPASHSTAIRYTIPGDATNAQLMITNESGKIFQQFSHLTSGESQIEISTSDIPSGTYQYSLYINGMKVDSKQMIITK